MSTFFAMKLNGKISPESRRNFISAGLVGGAMLPAAAFAQSTKSPLAPRSKMFNVLDFGASATGTKLDTKAIQAAVDACASAGGGVVHLPAGKYLSGTIFLKSKVCLSIEVGAVLLGSTVLEDYPSVRPRSVRTYSDYYVRNSLIYAEEQDHVTITGGGTIDGQGATFREQYPKRPYILRFIGCNHVEVSNIHLLNSPMWVQHYLECTHVSLHDLTVRSVCNANNDGIDLDACEKVRIANCDIISGDDSIVLKSTTDKPCQDVVITNCVLKSECNALKLGTESVGGFRNINMNNCAIYDTALSGLALETVDGGILENINVSNITMNHVKSAIYLRLGNRARPIFEGAPSRPVGSFRNVMIANVFADGVDKTGCAIAGLPERAMENITLQNIQVEYQGGGTKEDVVRAIPEKQDAYPEYINFGTLPAYGFYCRHVHGLRFENVRVSCKTPDQRPALVCDDVERLTLTAFQPASSDPVCLLRNTRDALISGNFAIPGNHPFLRAEGAATSNIMFTANPMALTMKQVELGDGVPAEAILLSGK